MAAIKSPLDTLSDEHKVVLKKLDALEETVDKLDQREKVASYLQTLVSGLSAEINVHLAKEEDALFPEMEKFMPRDAGPIGVMLMEHEDLRNTDVAMRQEVQSYAGISGGPAVQAAIREHATHFVGLLRDHISKEDNILFQMAAMHLSPDQMDNVARGFSEIESQK